MSKIRETIILINSPTTVVNILSSQHFIKDNIEAKKLIDDNFVKLNGRIISKNQSISSDDNLILLTPQSLEPNVNSDIKIIFEDEYILIVDKPAPLPIHPAGKYYFNTLTMLLKELYFDLTLHNVHRLDKETSGLVILAKSKECAQNLFSQFKSKSVKKEYLAIIYGKPKSSFSVSTPLIPSSFGDIRDAILPSDVGLPSKTNFELISTSSNNEFSLVRAIPLTGRKHQIRVHLSTLGFPIVGDKQYGVHPENFSAFIRGELSNTQIKSFWLSNSHFLHCNKISFTHPYSGKLVSFSSNMRQSMFEFLKKHHFNLL